MDEQPSDWKPGPAGWWGLAFVVSALLLAAFQGPDLVLVIIFLAGLLLMSKDEP